MTISAAVYCSAFITGSVFGSFFCTLALRAASAEYDGRLFALLTKPSHCDACGTRIPPHAMIPVIGYFLTGRRCPACRIRISVFYPLTEAASGFLLCGTVYSIGLSAYSACVYLMLCCAAVIAWIDIKKMVIPDKLTAAVVLLSVYPVIISSDWKSSLLGAALLGGFFFIIILLFPGGFGGGDMKFAAAIGFFAGLELSFVVLESALIAGSVFGIIYAIKSGRGFRIRIPFAPFLALGLFTAVFFGRSILLVYYSIF
ncbi:MAG: prepilin peptidase [Spirochaetota bacterium]